MSEYIDVYTYPLALTPEDRLTDGDTGKEFKIKENTLLIWVDLHPALRFVHDTVYIFISAEGVGYEKGEWWPVLNGERVLYGDDILLKSVARLMSHRGSQESEEHLN